MIIDTTQPYHRYFIAYIKAHSLDNGDTVVMRDYTAWILRQHQAFQQAKGIRYYDSYPPAMRAEFEQFIMGEG